MATSAQQSAPLNPVQIHLLQMFNYSKSEESLNELKNVLSQYYQNKLKKLTDEYWKTHNLTDEMMDEFAYGHDRISKK